MTTTSNPDSPLAGYYTEAEAAQVLGKTRRSLSAWRLARTGPPFVKVGISIFYRKSAVMEWLQGLEAAPLRDHPTRAPKSKARPPEPARAARRTKARAG